MTATTSPDHEAEGRARPAPGRRSLTYLPALDGLRGVSVLAVLLYHGDVSWMPGGFLGVEIFFVISGYLITSLLIGEHRRSGGVDLKNFWVRRARRLLPALFALIAVVVGVWLLFLPGEVAKIRGDVISSLTYVTNWHLIFSHQSYFDAMGRPSPLKHLWSLAVEEQFYLLWPLIFLGLMALFRGRRRWMAAAVAGGILVSTSISIWLYQPGTDPSRVYYGLDTRAAGLLAGSLLGILAPPWVLRGGLRRSARVVLDVLGAVAVVALVAMLVLIHDHDAFLYQGGFLVVDLATVAVILVLAHPGGVINRTVFSWKPLVWVGKRSYGIYIWHFPVFVLTRPGIDVHMGTVPLWTLRLSVTLALTEISYRWVETPIRNGSIGRLRERLRSLDPATVAAARRQARVALTGVTAVALVLGVGLLAAHRPSGPPPGFSDLADASVLNPAPVSNVADTVAPTTTLATTTPPTTAAVPGPTTVPPTTTPPTTQAPQAGSRITVMGDSVPLGASGALARRLPGLTINAQVGRQFSAAPSVLQYLRSQGLLRPIVVIHLGNNGNIPAGELDSVLNSLSSAQRVVLVTTHVPRSWQDSVNARLTDAVKSGAHPNTVLADWHALSAGHSGWFVSDGIHLSEAGATAYADLIAQAALG